MIELNLTGKRPLIMGILNVTPDSFSGDGVMQKEDFQEVALAQATQMRTDGADIIDIGGESTRPGATPVEAEEEKARVLPVIKALHEKYPEMALSIDTMKADVARAAVAAGVSILNDVSGIGQSPIMRQLAAETDTYLVQMHNRAQAQKISKAPTIGGEYKAASYEDVVKETAEELTQLANLAVEAGVSESKIILDPGIGFGKTLEENMRLINELDKIRTLGYPVLLGASRKSFIGRALGNDVSDRLEGTAGVVAVGTMRGANIIRVHDVRFMAQVVRMTAMIAA